MNARTHPRYAVACYWAPYLMLALLEGEEIIAFENPRFRRGGVNVDRFGQLLSQFVTRWSPDRLIVEARTAQRLDLPPSSHFITKMAVEEAKRALLDGKTSATHIKLYERLVERLPDLAELIRIRRTGKVLLAGYWPVAKLIPIALGLAAQRAASSNNP